MGRRVRGGLGARALLRAFVRSFDRLSGPVRRLASESSTSQFPLRCLPTPLVLPFSCPGTPLLLVAHSNISRLVLSHYFL